ncbi:MAG TPA: PHP domain-containing protein [Bryobacteraceae bacterium]|nr:PHP domain-containing protein [Bryobacteraceae bacterium]HOL71471.1 PHP domain-containing protein [Bryobacteraceae bacterium]HOQ47524.1 PHP domain-containing protein [Bryobacteraceae bacterium]HPQ16575.1 PHP domain-containing protein [Bryobacteraceae bacterium]HPU71459.1 PHP domain-containing protein [Bryobacteraceae bacterium]
MHQTRRIALLISCAILCLAAFAPVATAQQRNPLPVPNIPGYQTLKCDFHTHTVFSDGEVWPTTRVAEAWRDGLDAISITDHAGYNPNKEDVALKLHRPYEIASPAAAQAGIILIPGVEVMEGLIHANLLFVNDPNQFLGLSFLDALRKARAQNAFVVWNHPGWRQTPQWFPIIAQAYDEKLIQGMELVNGSDFYPEAYPWIAEKSWTILCNSDVHSPMPAVYRGGTRPITLVFARTADAAGIREALFARRTAAWANGEVWGTEEHLRALWQGAVKVENSTISLAGSRRSTVLRLTNSSAFRFRYRVRNKPEWLTLREGQVDPLGAFGAQLSASRQAPAGRHNVEIELEVTNFHVAPGRNLQVRLPLVVEVKPEAN